MRTLTAEDNIISAASCTTNCLALMAKGLNDFAPIVSGIMTTIHAWTGDQMPLDGPQRKGNKRRSRACAVNIVPEHHRCCQAIGLVLPELNGKLIGAAQRVLTPTGSITNLYAVVDKKVTVDEVNAAMKALRCHHLRDLRLQRGRHRLHRHHRRDPRLHLRRHLRPCALILATARPSFRSPLGTTTNSYTSQMVRTIKSTSEKFVA